MVSRGWRIGDETVRVVFLFVLGPGFKQGE